MPWMNRITWSGTALHAGVVPGYPASHGCIRLPFSFAPKLFKITTVGEQRRRNARPAGAAVDRASQPVPAAAAASAGDGDEGAAAAPVDERGAAASAPAQATSRHAGESRRFGLDHRRSVLDRRPRTSQGGAPTFATDKADDPAAVEDTHAHAFDPFAGQPAISTSVTASTNGHALATRRTARRASPAASRPSPSKSPLPRSQPRLRQPKRSRFQPR